MLNCAQSDGRIGQNINVYIVMHINREIRILGKPDKRYNMLIIRL
jgi:hypothetical protein